MGGTVLKISDLNNPWGICGFTASLGALYKANSKMKARIKGAAKDLATRIPAEIKTYLVILESEGKKPLLDEIESFTKTFKTSKKDYSTFTIKDYIARVNKLPSMADPTKEDFSIAMPANAVLDYLRRLCGLNAQLVDNRKLRQSHVILGLGSGKKGPRARWNGLGHWIYRHGPNTIYNYGKVETLQQVLSYPHLAGLSVQYQITVS